MDYGNFGTFDLGHVIQTAEAIKGMRRQSALDTLQQQYLKQGIDKNNFEMDAATARNGYLAALAVSNSDNPVADALQFAPDFVAEFDKVHGPGAFQALTSDQAKQMAARIAPMLAAKAGIQPAQRLRTIQGADGSLLQEDPLTGQITQVVKGSDPTNDQREFAQAQAEGFKGSFLDYQIALKRAGATNVNVSTDKKYGETLGGKIAESDAALWNSAQTAPELVARAQRVQELLKTGAYTGAGAEWKLAFGKAARMAGFNFGDSDIANTEALSQELAASTLDAIKSSGLGGGSGFSNADRDFLERVVGGKPVLEKATLVRIASLNERAARKTIERWNARRKNISPEILKSLGLGDDVQLPQGKPSADPPRIATPAEAARLPSGTQFIDPNGVLRQVP